MPWMIPAAIFGGALLGGSASRSAASQQSDAAKQAAEMQRQQFSEQALLQEPFRQVGIRALPKLEAQQNMMPGAFTGRVDLGQDPGYAFRLSEGQKALERSAAARGGLISGGALKAATRFGQEMGSQEYTNAFNRYQAERQARLGPLQSLTGMGQTTAQQLGAAGTQNASAIGNYGMQGANAAAEGYMGAANARASGYMGGYNALNSGLGTYLNYSNQQNLLAALKGNTGLNPYKPQIGFDASSVTA